MSDQEISLPRPRPRRDITSHAFDLDRSWDNQTDKILDLRNKRRARGSTLSASLPSSLASSLARPLSADHGSRYVLYCGWAMCAISPAGCGPVPASQPSGSHLVRSGSYISDSGCSETPAAAGLSCPLSVSQNATSHCFFLRAGVLP